jgi:hypothetical protein
VPTDALPAAVVALTGAVTDAVVPVVALLAAVVLAAVAEPAGRVAAALPAAVVGAVVGAVVAGFGVSVAALPPPHAARIAPPAIAPASPRKRRRCISRACPCMSDSFLFHT